MIINTALDLANNQTVTYKGFQMSQTDLDLLKQYPYALRGNKPLAGDGWWKYILTALNPVQAILVREVATTQAKREDTASQESTLIKEINKSQGIEEGASLQAKADAAYITANYTPNATVAAMQKTTAKKENVAAFLVPAAIITAAGFFLMIVSMSGNESLGMPMLFPVTWEENVAANMTKIPMWELFPGLMVKDLYKAYRAGVDSGAIKPDQSEATIFYIASSTGKSAVVVADFLSAMVKTVAAGKADPAILTATQSTGIEEKIPQFVTPIVSTVSKGATQAMGTLTIVAIAALVLYSASIGILPKPKFGTGNK